MLLYEYRQLVGDVSVVCSEYVTSLYPLLLVLMLVFDGAGIQIYSYLYFSEGSVQQHTPPC